MNKSKNIINIHISGCTNSGKSSLLLMINKMLITKGFNVEVKCDDSYVDLDNNLEMAREKVILDKIDKIILTEVQTNTK